MEILIAILVIAVIAAVVFAVVQRRSAGASGLGRARSSPIGRSNQGPSQHPLAAAVVDQMQATDPQDVRESEQRLQAQARQVAAGLAANAHSTAAEHQRAPDGLAHDGPYPADPRADGYADPAPDPAYGGPDPAYGGDPRVDRRHEGAVPGDDDDARYDGRRAEDPVDPRYDDRRR